MAVNYENGKMAGPDQLAAVAQRAEKLGFYGILSGDHIALPDKLKTKYPYERMGDASASGSAPSWDDYTEQLTTQAFLAAKTTQIHLVTGIMVLPYRNPVLAAKMLASIDVLSKGRLIAGVGIGWMKEEFEALRTPPFEERGKVATEYIRLFRELWTKDHPDFQGKYYTVSGIKFAPKPVQKPHPPIWVGGESPGAMRRAAALGNAWFPIGGRQDYPLDDLQQLKVSIDKLVKYVKEADRVPSEVEIGYWATQFKMVEGSTSNELFVGSADKISSNIMDCEKLGVNYIIFDFLAHDVEDTLDNLDKFARDIMPRVK